MAIFSDAGSGIKGHDDSKLTLEMTRPGQLLQKPGFEFTAVNITEASHRHWQLKEQVLNELCPEFAAEGNLFIFNNLLRECAHNGKPIDCRFLYLAVKR